MTNRCSRSSAAASLAPNELCLAWSLCLPLVLIAGCAMDGAIDADDLDDGEVAGAGAGLRTLACGTYVTASDLFREARTITVPVYCHRGTAGGVLCVPESQVGEVFPPFFPTLGQACENLGRQRDAQALATTAAFATCNAANSGPLSRDGACNGACTLSGSRGACSSVGTTVRVYGTISGASALPPPGITWRGSCNFEGAALTRRELSLSCGPSASPSPSPSYAPAR